MTDKLSERADQLADAIGVSTWGIPRNRAIEKILSFAADSANLARGLALEQAAQVADVHLNAGHIHHTEGGDIAVTKHGYPEMNCTARIANAIRSLDPDAAQALAAHEDRKYAEWSQRWIDRGAEIERRARLDGENAGMLAAAKILCVRCRRSEPIFERDGTVWHSENESKTCQAYKIRKEPRMLAALAESQPALAGEPQKAMCTCCNMGKVSMVHDADCEAIKGIHIGYNGYVVPADEPHDPEGCPVCEPQPQAPEETSE